MAEMQDALRSCMEKLLIAREERDQIIVEAASEISSEQKKVRDLQHKLEDANKKAAKLAAENNSFCKAVDAKDKLIRELKESKAASDDKLIDAKAKLDAAQKQCASLQYEVCMLQKELEIRSQEREYDLKSVDAARRQQTENLKKIAQLEGECQRLRTMVRKRLPGPAALSKMRDEVEQRGASPRRPRSATPMSPRSVTPMTPRSVTPMTPRSVTPMSSQARPMTPRSVTPMSSQARPMTPRSVTPMSSQARPMTPRSVTPMSSQARPMTPRRTSEPESYTVKLRAIEDENKILKQMLAKRDTELQFVQMKYADEACKLSVVQRQLKELTGENKQLSDANGQSESWASALISELEHFRAGKHGASVVASDMSLLDDFAEIEKLEMASGDEALRPSGVPQRNAPRASPKKADSTPVMSEKNGKDPVQDGSVSNGHPEWVQNIQELVIHKHEASGESIDTILQEIRRALDHSAMHANGDASDVLYDRTEIEKMVTNLIEKITSVIRRSAEDNVAKCGPLLHDKSEFCARLEYLVHVCYDLLHGKANLEKFIDEVCLVLEYIVSQYFSNQDRSDTMDNNTKNFDGDESSNTVNAHGDHDMQSAKLAAPLDIQTEAHNESFLSEEGQIPDHILVDHEESHLDEELARVLLDQDDNSHPERKSSYCEIESPAADGSVEDLIQQKVKQLARNSQISAAADKLVECQETITNLSRQLQALQSPANSGTVDSSLSNPGPSSDKSDYKPQSLASILAEEDSNTEGSSSPTPKQVHSKKEDEPDAAPERIIAQEQNADAALNANDEESTQIVVHPVFPEPRHDEISADPKKKKRSPSLLGRIIFRKKVEGSY